MNSYDMRFQFVDSPQDQSTPAGEVGADGLIREFRKFPFAEQVKKAETLDAPTFPTLIFKRQSDGEEIAIWTDNAKRFDLCLARDSAKSFLNGQTADEVEALLRRFETESVLDIQSAQRRTNVQRPESVTSSTAGMVIYDSRVRWVAAINLAFVVAGIYFGVRYVPNFGKYVIVVFLALFSLFWIKGFLFGFRIKLVSDGRQLSWQEGKNADAIELRNITRIVVDVSRPSSRIAYSSTTITFRQTDGEKKSLPPNIASGLRARDWRRLRELIAHIRTVAMVTVDATPYSGLKMD